jgi:hypothetical protein
VLLKTTILPPKQAVVVLKRARLLERLSAGRSRRVTLLEAPAGMVECVASPLSLHETMRKDHAADRSPPECIARWDSDIRSIPYEENSSHGETEGVW